MKVPDVKSPLSIIALFVLVIELFLAYPVTQLDGREQLIIVVFMTVFPFFVCSLFFYILWHNPLHLYSPKDIPPGHVELYLKSIARKKASLVIINELQEENRKLLERTTQADAAVILPTTASQLEKEGKKTIEETIAQLEAEFKAQMEADEIYSPDKIDLLANKVLETRRAQADSIKEEQAHRVQQKMSEFANWLSSRGFSDLPDMPEVIIESPSLYNAYYDQKNDEAHFGERIIDDLDVLAHTYFHSVLISYGVLTRFESLESLALVEGFCDYYACSYNDNPKVAEKFALVAGLKTNWLRNLDEIVNLSQVAQEPHQMSLVWSGSCWELRQHYGAKIVDEAVKNTIMQLGVESSIKRAALIIQEQMANIEGKHTLEKVQIVFQKRGVDITS